MFALELRSAVRSGSGRARIRRKRKHGCKTVSDCVVLLSPSMRKAFGPLWRSDQLKLVKRTRRQVADTLAKADAGYVCSYGAPLMLGRESGWTMECRHGRRR